MSTPHISAEMGDFAKTVLMPGDPLRAKFIADTFLQDVRQVTGVRGMLGFTGTYEGRPISVMGSGMGMPSIGIYSYELFSQYGVENIIRIGSAGSYTDKAKLFDVVLATGAYSESNYAVTQSGDTDDIQTPSAELNDALRASAKAANIPLIEGNIHSSDVFYRQPSDAKPTYWEKLRDENFVRIVAGDLGTHYKYNSLTQEYEPLPAFSTDKTSADHFLTGTNDNIYNKYWTQIVIKGNENYYMQWKATNTDAFADGLVGVLNPVAFAPALELYSSHAAGMEDYFNAEITKLIYGSDSSVTVDSIKAGWIAAGTQEAIDEVRAWYNDSKEA